MERFFFLSYSAFPNLFSLFLGLPQHILPRKAAIIVFFNFFLLFFGIFYYELGRNSSERFFFSLSLSAFPNLFWLGKKQQWCFLIFLNFFATFFEFSITGRVGTRSNDFFCFCFSHFLGLSQLILA